MKKNVYIACFPKSASSYLTALLQQNFNLKPVSMTPGSGGREQEPTELRMFFHNLNLKTGFVAQVHTRASKPVLDMFKKYKIKPLILTRDIHDVIISLKDHLLSEGPALPMAYVNEDFNSFSEEKQLDFIIEFIVPWYFNFFLGWDTIRKENTLPLKWITYEDYIKNKESTLDSIAEFYDLKTPNNGYELEKLQRRTRKNKGVKGRGKAQLTKQQLDKIRSYTDFYPNVDFSLMGL